MMGGLFEQRKPLLERVRFRASQGFTIVEMLAALAVLSIMTAMVATGVSAGVRSYERTQFVSQADMLAATIDSTLSEPFRFMRKSSTDGEYIVRFENQDVTISESPQPLVADENGRLYLSGKVGAQSKQIKVVNDGIYGDCKVSLESSSSESCSMDKVEYRYRISDLSGELTRDYSFVVKPLDGVSRDYAVDSGTGSGGGQVIVDDNKVELVAEITRAAELLEAGGKSEGATSALRNALTAAERVRDKDNASTREIQEATNNLKAARIAYEQEGKASFDLGVLTAAITRTPSSLDGRFDSSIVQRVQDAYSKAVSQRDNPTSQDDVDKAAKELNDALDAYEKQRYTTSLSSSITSAETALLTERVDANGVTAWLNQALSNARAALNNPAGYSQSQIDGYTKDLQDATAAYNNLGKKSSGGGGDSGGNDFVGQGISNQGGLSAEAGSAASSSLWGNPAQFRWYIEEDGRTSYAIARTFDNGDPSKPSNWVGMIYYQGKYYKSQTSWWSNDEGPQFSDSAVQQDGNFDLGHLNEAYYLADDGRFARWIEISI